MLARGVQPTPKAFSYCQQLQRLLGTKLIRWAVLGRETWHWSPENNAVPLRALFRCSCFDYVVDSQSLRVVSHINSKVILRNLFQIFSATTTIVFITIGSTDSLTVMSFRRSSVVGLFSSFHLCSFIEVYYWKLFVSLTKFQSTKESN